MRVKKGVADAWAFNWRMMWANIAQVCNNRLPITDANGYGQFQTDYYPAYMAQG